MKSFRFILLLVIGTGLLPAAGNADTADKLLECDRLTDPTLKLACYDAVVDGLKSPAPDAEPETVAPAAAPAPRPAAAANVPTDVPAAVAAPAAATASPAAEVSGNPVPTADDTFGLEDRIAAREREAVKAEASEQRVAARVVQVKEHHDRRFSVLLDNGQVWRETQGSRVGIPKVGADVEISTGSFGGYRMTIDGIGRQAWVARTR